MAALHVEVADGDELPAGVLEGLRELTFAAFGGRFDQHDWEHTYGGWRVVALEEGVPVAGAAVVPRLLAVDDRAFAAGYVEGVATAPGRERQGLGSAVLTAVGALLREQYELGALSTGRHAFYERLGWERWGGPTQVRHDDGRVQRTPDDDGGLLVLRCPASADLDPTAAITCEERPGDDW